MKIRLNQKVIEFNGRTISDLFPVAQEGDKSDAYAVFVNRALVLKSQWRSHVLNEDDSISIVVPAEGG